MSNSLFFPLTRSQNTCSMNNLPTVLYQSEPCYYICLFSSLVDHVFFPYNSISMLDVRQLKNSNRQKWKNCNISTNISCGVKKMA